MFRKRLVAVSILASAVVSSSLGITTIARAQEVLDLDAPTPPKGNKKPAKTDKRRMRRLVDGFLFLAPPRAFPVAGRLIAFVEDQADDAKTQAVSR